MVVKKIEILNYRNIAEADICFSDNVNCFVGKNGEGKTNLLDAIYFLSFTKSAACNIDSMNIRHGEDVMMLRGIYDLNGVDEVIQCGLKRGQAKQMRRNAKLYKRMSEHVGLLPVILVSPGDSELIGGGSAERRRFMDIVISQTDKGYLASLVRYDKALQQRNSLLKMMSEQEGMRVDEDLMAMYEEVMAEEGTKIYQGRKQFVDEFVPVFQEYYNIISQGREDVGLQYVSHCERGPLLDVIRQDRRKDIAVGYSLHGIHKDEMEMTLGGFGIKREGSQGQNKTYLIALKLAQFDFLRNTGSRTTPILLLDDIFDKLDATRVEQIVKLVSDERFGQIFISDTNREHIDLILQRTGKDYKIFSVSAGNVEEQKPIV